MTPDSFEKIFAYRFEQQAILDQALSHRSFSRNANNERLEFLGDSVLNLVISDHIYKQLADANEGDLSRVRASLVNEAALARVARDIGLGDNIYLGGGELKSGGFRRASILADTLEAIIGAIYLDGGFRSAQKSILTLYQEYLQVLPEISNLKDPKTELQEHLQGRQFALPDYQIVQTVGKSHDQLFTVSCQIDELSITTKGVGSSRKKAEQAAAKKALEKLTK